MTLRDLTQAGLGVGPIAAFVVAVIAGVIWVTGTNADIRRETTEAHIVLRQEIARADRVSSVCHSRVQNIENSLKRLEDKLDKLLISK